MRRTPAGWRRRKWCSEMRAAPTKSFLPRMTLGDSHIAECPSFGDAVEVLEAVPEGNGTRSFGGGIAIPSAQPCDDPGGPGEGSFGMGVLLLGCTRRVLIGFDGVEGGDLVWAEGDRGGLQALSIAGLEQLHDQGGSMGRDGGELEQAIGGFDLAVFQPQT